MSFLILVLLSGCFAQSNLSFSIKVGKEPSELMIKKNPWGYSGPNAIRAYDNDIYILDQENFKINVYTMQGQYKNSYNCQNDTAYSDIDIDSQGNIMLLTNKGIYKILKNGEMLKSYDIPEIMKNPQFFSISESGNIAINGTSKDGREKSGIINTNGNFTELKGYRIFISEYGLIGLQVSETSVNLIEDGKVIDHININVKPYMIPIGIANDKSIYCTVSSENQGYILLYKINKKGIVAVKEVRLKSLISSEDIGLITSIRVNKNGEIILLEGNKENCRVTIVKI